jgi:hypothetical protein
MNGGLWIVPVKLQKKNNFQQSHKTTNSDCRLHFSSLRNMEFVSRHFMCTSVEGSWVYKDSKYSSRPISPLSTTVKQLQLDLRWPTHTHPSLVRCNESVCKQMFQSNCYFFKCYILYNAPWKFCNFINAMIGHAICQCFMRVSYLFFSRILWTPTRTARKFRTAR